MIITDLNQVLNGTKEKEVLASEAHSSSSRLLHSIHLYRDKNECVAKICDVLGPYAKIKAQMQQDIGEEITDDVSVERGKFGIQGLGQDADIVDLVGNYFDSAGAEISDLEKNIIAHWCTEGGIPKKDADQLIGYSSYLYDKNSDFFTPEFRDTVELQKSISQGGVSVEELMSSGDTSKNIIAFVKNADGSQIANLLSNNQFKSFIAASEDQAVLDLIDHAVESGKLETAQALVDGIDFSTLDKEAPTNAIENLIFEKYGTDTDRDPDRKSVEYYVQVAEKLGSDMNLSSSFGEICNELLDNNGGKIAVSVGNYLVDSGKITGIKDRDIRDLFRASVYSDDKELQSKLASSLPTREVQRVLNRFPRSKSTDFFQSEEMEFGEIDKKAFQNILDQIKERGFPPSVSEAMWFAARDRKADNLKLLLDFSQENKVLVNYEHLFDALGMEPPSVEITLNGAPLESEAPERHSDEITHGVIGEILEKAYIQQELNRADYVAAVPQATEEQLTEASNTLIEMESRGSSRQLYSFPNGQAPAMFALLEKAGISPRNLTPDSMELSSEEEFFKLQEQAQSISQGKPQGMANDNAKDLSADRTKDKEKGGKQ